MSKTKANVEVRQETSAKPPPPVVAEGWAPFMSLRDEVERLFNDFGAGLWKRSLATGVTGQHAAPAGWHASPALEVADCDGEYRLTAELPGMKPEEVEIKLTDGAISIRGEKTEEKKEEKDDYILSERHYGAFHRSLPLPSGVDAAAVSANFSNGILTVTMPKSKEAKSKERKIEVKAA